MITRREFSIAIASTPAILYAAKGMANEDIKEKLKTSQLVYITPIKSNGEESKCKAEIWFLYHDDGIHVVTPTDAWRTEAIRKGLTSARIWVGEFGNWRRANDAFRAAPELMASGEIVTDTEVHAVVLEGMGIKYSSGWDSWGPRFKSSLEDGSRAVLRYSQSETPADA